MSADQYYQVNWLRLALWDIAVYDTQDSPEAVKAAEKHIWQEAQGLCLLADRGRLGRVPGTGELVLEGLSYFLAYRVKGKPSIFCVSFTHRGSGRFSNCLIS